MSCNNIKIEEKISRGRKQIKIINPAKDTDTAGPMLCLQAVFIAPDRTASVCECSGRDFVFLDTNVVKPLQSALRLVAGNKHAPRAFDRATSQAGASSDLGLYETKQNARKANWAN